MKLLAENIKSSASKETGINVHTWVWHQHCPLHRSVPCTACAQRQLSKCGAIPLCIAVPKAWLIHICMLFSNKCLCFMV